jgi:hypothetical protein
MFSVTVRDTVQQTSGVLAALADQADGRAPAPIDFTPWHALQEWLRLAGAREVTIPYAPLLAGEADSRAVRLRRDFGALLNLIRAHALLHQQTRERDAFGRIVATLDDYRVAHGLVIDLISEGVQAAVKPETREAVEAVRALDTPGAASVTYQKVAEYLGLDKSAARRRCEVAVREGYLVNRQERRNQPAMLSVGDAMPSDVHVLPPPDSLCVVMTPPAPAPPCHRSEDPNARG